MIGAVSGGLAGAPTFEALGARNDGVADDAPADVLTLDPASAPVNPDRTLDAVARPLEVEGPPAEPAPARLGRASGFQGDDVSLAAALLSPERSPLELRPDLRFEFSRGTRLRDGGVNGSRGALSDDKLAGYADGRGEIDVYDVALRWDAFSPGPLTFSLITGLKAVDANIVNARDEYDASGAYVSTRLEDGRGVTPVPIFGGGVRWDVGRGIYLSGAAQTHTIPDGASLLDVIAEGGIDFSPTVGLRAGYQYLHTGVRVQDLDASVSVSGVFARLEITF